jgi:hypothetical protein
MDEGGEKKKERVERETTMGEEGPDPPFCLCCGSQLLDAIKG